MRGSVRDDGARGRTSLARKRLSKAILLFLSDTAWATLRFMGCMGWLVCKESLQRPLRLLTTTYESMGHEAGGVRSLHDWVQH